MVKVKLASLSYTYPCWRDWAWSRRSTFAIALDPKKCCIDEVLSPAFSLLSKTDVSFCKEAVSDTNVILSEFLAQLPKLMLFFLNFWHSFPSDVSAILEAMKKVFSVTPVTPPTWQNRLSCDILYRGIGTKTPSVPAGCAVCCTEVSWHQCK